MVSIVFIVQYNVLRDYSNCPQIIISSFFVSFSAILLFYMFSYNALSLSVKESNSTFALESTITSYSK